MVRIGVEMKFSNVGVPAFMKILSSYVSPPDLITPFANKVLKSVHKTLVDSKPMVSLQQHQLSDI